MLPFSSTNVLRVDVSACVLGFFLGLGLVGVTSGCLPLAPVDGSDGIELVVLLVVFLVVLRRERVPAAGIRWCVGVEVSGG